MMRRVGRAERVVEEERLVGRDHLRVRDELDRLVGEVLSEVVPLGRDFGWSTGVVVVDQVRIPLVGLGPEEPVPALEPPSGGPVPPVEATFISTVGHRCHLPTM